MGGDFDLEVALAVRFGWRPEEVAAMDPDFLGELTAYLNAQAQRAQAVAARRAQRARRRSGSYSGQRGTYEVADVPVA